jgi:hypothetical protein
MYDWKSRLWEWFRRYRARFDTVATWSDTPEGRLVRWAVGVLVTLMLYSLGAGHPLG